jgi:UDP-N-acetylmuramoylalanine--D-glutamate ligase
MTIAGVPRGGWAALDRSSDWSAWRVVVAGIGVAGYAAADALMQLGAHVTIVDAADGERQRERAGILEALGATSLLGHSGSVPPSTDLLVVSPQLRPSAPIVVDALARGLPVWGDLELAWRLRRTAAAAEWLCVTGTTGAAETTLMLESMLRAAGQRVVAAGACGLPIVDVVMHDDLDAIAVEVDVRQLAFVHAMSPLASVCLGISGVGADVDAAHFGSMAARLAALARVYERTQRAAVYNVSDDATMRMVEDADVVEGCRAVGFTLGVPSSSMVGLVADELVDRAFIADRAAFALPLAEIDDVHPPAPDTVTHALAAAALARAYGVEGRAIRDGLRSFHPAAYRVSTVGVASGVTFIDASHATDAPSALAALAAPESMVWIAGGLAKGQEFDDLVVQARSRLRGVVVLGADRRVLADALARHAPDVPVIVIESPETGAMVEVVQQAAGLARSGDVVILAPACAVWDMFQGHADLGRQYADAVALLPGLTAAGHGAAEAVR